MWFVNSCLRFNWNVVLRFIWIAVTYRQWILGVEECLNSWILASYCHFTFFDTIFCSTVTFWSQTFYKTIYWYCKTQQTYYHFQNYVGKQYKKRAINLFKIFLNKIALKFEPCATPDTIFIKPFFALLIFTNGFGSFKYDKFSSILFNQNH